MFHIRGEGQELQYGFNFYPWSERKWSVGFVLRLSRLRGQVRWAPHVRKFYCRFERAVPIEQERAELQAWLSR